MCISVRPILLSLCLFTCSLSYFCSRASCLHSLFMYELNIMVWNSYYIFSSSNLILFFIFSCIPFPVHCSDIIADFKSGKTWINAETSFSMVIKSYIWIHSYFDHYNIPNLGNLVTFLYSMLAHLNKQVWVFFMSQFKELRFSFNIPPWL